MDLTTIGITLGGLGIGSGVVTSVLASRWHIFETYKIITGKRQEDEMLIKQQQIQEGAALRGTSGYITTPSGIGDTSTSLSTGLILSTALQTTETSYGEEVDATDILDKRQEVFMERRHRDYQREEVFNRTGVLDTDNSSANYQVPNGPQAQQNQPYHEPQYNQQNQPYSEPQYNQQQQQYDSEQRNVPADAILDIYSSTPVEAQEVQQNLKAETTSTYYTQPPLKPQPRRRREVKMQTEVIIHQPRKEVEMINVGKYSQAPMREQDRPTKTPARYALPNTEQITQASKTTQIQKVTVEVQREKPQKPKSIHRRIKPQATTNKRGYREIGLDGKVKHVQPENLQGYGLNQINAHNVVLDNQIDAFIAAPIDLNSESVEQVNQNTQVQPLKQDTQVLNAPPEKAYDATQVLVQTEELQGKEEFVDYSTPITAQLDNRVVNITRIDRGGAFDNA